MNKGTVKFFDAGRGGLSESIGENETVTFELKPGKKGLNAINVKLA